MMRERLIELIDNYTESVSARELHSQEFCVDFVDYLLANGVIVPPCKVGDTVYAISDSRVSTGEVIEISMFPEISVTLEIRCDYDCDDCPFGDWTQNYGGDYSCSGEYGTMVIQDKEFGKTVFLTSEEAEQALKGE